MARPSIVLVGPPGSGKSAVAKSLSRLSGLPRVDTDDEVSAKAGKSVPDIFIEDGEAEFRRMERESVAHALSTFEGIVSLGGGAVMDEDTRADLAGLREQGTGVVFLDASLAAAMPRVGLGASRPLLAGNPRQQWRTLMEKRRPVYEEVSSCSVLTDELTPWQVAQIIAEECTL